MQNAGLPKQQYFPYRKTDNKNQKDQMGKHQIKACVVLMGGIIPQSFLCHFSFFLFLRHSFRYLNSTTHVIALTFPSILCPKRNKPIATINKNKLANGFTFVFKRLPEIINIATAYNSNPIACSNLLAGCLCVFLTAFSKLNLMQS